MASGDEPRRRFAPVPIETTFQSVRKTPQQPGGPRIGPAGELTPDASPRSLSPPPQETAGRRRFAPQLIETSRRARRVGDDEPATRPTDKTDITPYTKNIYTAKPKSRRKVDSSRENEAPGHEKHRARRETEDEAVTGYLLDLAAREAERQMEEVALAAFPNSRAREGGVAHFYFRESSGSDNSPQNESPSEDQSRRRSRRKSSNLGLNWWHTHMQEHAQELARRRGVPEMAVDAEMPDLRMVSDAELDQMDLTVPPDPLWTTTNPAEERSNPVDVMVPMLDVQHEEAMRDGLPPAITKAPELPYPTSSFKPPGASPEGGLGRPFGAFGMKPDSPQLEKMRQLASPPMLGKELTFRTCPSPKLTKLEPTHPFIQHQEELQNRDTSGRGGLWQGYCCKTGAGEEAPTYAHLTGPRMMATPAQLPGTPAESFEADTHSLSEEPASLFSSTASSSDNASSLSTISTAEHRGKNGQSKGLHMLHNVDERLQKEKVRVERAEQIAQEFNDEFITQVYNYLSLGYPATACVFDEELSKISGISTAELRINDEKQMAKGHMLEMKLDETPEEDRCPRWRALKVYITEWARQHPNLNNLDPLAWGVRERKGSWAF